MKPFHKPYFPLVFLWFCLLRFCYFIQTYSTVTAFFNVLLNDFTWVMTTESAIYLFCCARNCVPGSRHTFYFGQFLGTDSLRTPYPLVQKSNAHLNIPMLTLFSWQCRWFWWQYKRGIRYKAAHNMQYNPSF